MVLPSLDPALTEFASRSGLRELFWFGRSSCTYDESLLISEQVCMDSDKIWIHNEGWNEKLR